MALMAMALSLNLAGCASSLNNQVEIKVFAASSLTNVMEEVVARYSEINPNTEIILNSDSSGTLVNQIREGAACDVFFSAAQKQMNVLEEEGLVVTETRKNVVSNRLVVIALKESETKVTGLADIGKADSFALAAGSVPAGKYTRAAFASLGILSDGKSPEEYSSQEVSDALGGICISEQGNVNKVLMTVSEGSCEVGTAYLSDLYGYEDKVEVIETVSEELSGSIVYPIAVINNDEASKNEIKAARDFVNYITSDEAKDIFKAYYFGTDVN